MKEKPTYDELEKHIAELKKQNEILNKSVKIDKISDDKYRKMIGNIGDVIVIVDRKGLNAYKSPNIEKYFGWKPEDVIGKSTFKNVHIEDLEIAQKFIQTIVNEPEVVKTAEIRYKCKDGSYKWIEFTCINLLHDPDINGLLGNYHDISERKFANEELIAAKEKAEQNEEELLKTQILLKSSIESTKDLIVLSIDNNYKYLYFNNIHKSVMKSMYSIEVEVGMNILDCISMKDDYNKAKTNYGKALAGNSHSIIEIYGGTTKSYFESFFNPIRNEKNEIIGATAYAKDITERIQVEKSLQESEDRYKGLFKNLKSPLSLYEIVYSNKGEPCDYRFLAVNSSYEKAVGKTNSDLVGKTLLEVFPGTEASWLEQIKKTCITGITSTKENYAKEVDLYVELTVYIPQKGQMAFICPNITVRKKAELELVESQILLKKQNEELHMKNSEYSALNEEYKTQNEELHIAKVKAEESDRLKTEFINNMSHEIRTPMNGILGFSDFLNDKNLSAEKRRNYINIIQNSGNQLMRIIDDILEISKLGTKQVKTTEKEICLNDLLLEKFSIFDIKAKENKTPLYLKKGLSDIESTILTDDTKLNKIISNVLENALKFTNTGFIEFGYQLKNEELEIYVKDTGIGIKPDKQEIIFERFSQEEKELSKNVGGLGLGLSIAKENAELLGGKITLKSEKGKGSTFFVTIPYKPSKSKTNIEKDKIIEKQDKYTILIVEDEEINYLYIETLLEDKIEINCNILHAKNGKEAVEICNENQELDFILMDLKMPIMNGFEATKIIKEFKPDLPIVAQTAYTTKEDKVKALSAGCDDFISKPIDEETLNEIINKYLITK